MLLDAHFHLDRYLDANAILDEIEQNAITGIAVTNHLTSYVQTRLLARGYHDVWVAVGLHPGEVAVHRWEIDEVLSIMQLEPIVGEVGLDGTERTTLTDPDGTKHTTRRKRSATEMDLQAEALRAIFQVCDNRPKILSLHSQDAVQPLVELISKYNLPRAVWHWYTGDESSLRRIIEMGHYLSVGPAITRHNSPMQTWLNDWVPRERILTETDGPYGDKGKLRRDALRSVLYTLATVWHCSFDEATSQVKSNLEQLTSGIPELSVTA